MGGELFWSEKMMESNEQMLYLIKNEFGLHKIGISNNPDRRVREVASASGVNCELVAAWGVQGVDARDCEKYLHDKLAEYRKKGEWFKFRAKNIVKLVENSLPDKRYDISVKRDIDTVDWSCVDLRDIKRIACGEYVDGFLGWSDVDKARDEIKKIHDDRECFMMYKLDVFGRVSKFNAGTHTGDWPSSVFPNKEAAIHASIEISKGFISDLENRINKLKEEENYNPLYKAGRKVDRLTRMYHDSFGCIVYKFDYSGILHFVKSIVCDKNKSCDDMEKDEYLFVFTDEKGFFIDYIDHTKHKLCTRVYEDYIDFYRFNMEDDTRLSVLKLKTKNTIDGSKTVNDLEKNSWISLNRIL